MNSRCVSAPFEKFSFLQQFKNKINVVVFAKDHVELLDLIEIFLDDKLLWREHSTNKVTKATNAIWACRKAIQAKWGIASTKTRSKTSSGGMAVLNYRHWS